MSTEFGLLMKRQQRAFHGFMRESLFSVLMIAGGGLGYQYLAAKGWVAFYLVLLFVEAASAFWAFLKWQKYDNLLRQEIGLF